MSKSRAFAIWTRWSLFTIWSCHDFWPEPSPTTINNTASYKLQMSSWIQVITNTRFSALSQMIKHMYGILVMTGQRHAPVAELHDPTHDASNAYFGVEKSTGDGPCSERSRTRRSSGFPVSKWVMLNGQCSGLWPDYNIN